MRHYNRDAEDLRRALQGHSIAGYPLSVPVFENGFAIRSSTTVGPRGAFTGVMVRPAEPMRFDEFAKRMNWTNDKLSLDGWVNYLKHLTTPSEDYTAPLKMLLRRSSCASRPARRSA